MNAMLRHKNMFVRGVALLYLRNVGEPQQLMNWCEPHLEDETLFGVTSDGRPTSMAEWLLKLVTEVTYCGTMLRRIPVPIVREFERKGMEVTVKRERSERVRGMVQKGLKCRARYTDGGVYDVVVEQVMDNGRFYVTYTEYGNEEEIGITDFELASLPTAAAKAAPRPQAGDRGGRGDRERGGRDSARDRGRDRDRDRGRDRDRDRKRRSRSRSRSRSRDRKGGSRDRSRRSRSPGGGGDGGGGGGGAAATGMTIEEEVAMRLKKARENERSSAVSSDGKYCAQIVSYKKSLSKQFRGGQTFDTTNKKLDLPDSHPRGSYDRDRGGRGRDRDRERRRSPSPEQSRKRELTHEQKMKQVPAHTCLRTHSAQHAEYSTQKSHTSHSTQFTRTPLPLRADGASFPIRRRIKKMIQTQGLF